MRRVAFTMKLNPGCADEYRKRHADIWPELKELLTSSGIRDYSIYLDEMNNILFATLKLTEDNTNDSIPEQEAVKRWWDYMSDIMETHPDKSPVQYPLLEVFHLD